MQVQVKDCIFKGLVVGHQICRGGWAPEEIGGHGEAKTH